MTMVTAAVAAFTAVCAIVYRRVWVARDHRGRTPTGFGLVFAVALLCAAAMTGLPAPVTLALVLTTVGTFAYWFDDIFEIGAWVRLAMAFAFGVAVCLPFVVALPWAPMAIFGALLAAGFVNLVLVNIVNFQDGADLNIALLLGLTGLLLIVFANPNDPWWVLGVSCLAFALVFALFNRHPRTLYFGDSGCFAFATLLTIMGITYVTGPRPPAEAAIPVALPVIDAIFVTALRIRMRQRFTVRHYFHLYQRLQRDQAGFAYLWPQIANTVLCLLGAGLLLASGFDRFTAVAVAMVVVTLGLFLFWRHRFVLGEPGPPHSQSA